jgi:dienelactone hydrolase
MPDEDLLLDNVQPVFGTGIVGVCDICHARQAVIVLSKERYKLCVQDFLNKSWLRTTEKPGALTLPFSSFTEYVPTRAVPGGQAISVRLKPTKTVKHPLVTIVTDIFGPTAEVLEAGIRFARAGYEVVIPDIGRTPGFGLPKHMFDWSMNALTGTVPISASKRERLFKVVDVCRRKALEDITVDPSHQAIFGISYGGALALAYATESTDLSAVVLAYPDGLPPQSRLATLKAPVFVMCGGKDKAAGTSSSKLESAAKKWGFPVEVCKIDGADRRFLSRDDPKYRVQVAEAGWRVMMFYLKDKFEPPPAAPAKPAPPAAAPTEAPKPA